MSEQKRIVITGVSSGIGLTTAKTFAQMGWKVFGCSRHATQCTELRELGVQLFDVDLKDDSQIVQFVNNVQQATTTIDALINGAGYGLFGALEEVPLADARKEMEVDVFALARLTQLVLPMMREQHCGKIVNISSMAGRSDILFGDWYHAAKFAVEGLSDALRAELIPFGIRVVIIEPGVTRTNWGAIAAETLLKTSGEGPYATEAKKMAHWLTTNYDPKTNPGMTDPQVITDAIVEAVTSEHPKTRYLIGQAVELVEKRQTMPDHDYDLMMRTMILGPDSKQ